MQIVMHLIKIVSSWRKYGTSFKQTLQNNALYINQDFEKLIMLND